MMTVIIMIMIMVIIIRGRFFRKMSSIKSIKSAIPRPVLTSDEGLGHGNEWRQQIGNIAKMTITRRQLR